LGISLAPSRGRSDDVVTVADDGDSDASLFKGRWIGRSAFRLIRRIFDGAEGFQAKSGLLSWPTATIVRDGDATDVAVVMITSSLGLDPRCGIVELEDVIGGVAPTMIRLLRCAKGRTN